MLVISRRILFGLFVACLLQATVEDCRNKKVHRVIWWRAGAVGLGLIAVSAISPEKLPGGMSPEGYGAIAFDILSFALLQRFLFSKMYGMADVYAFTCCSLAWASLGGGLREYLFHMLVSILLLGIVQLFRRNIASDGNLREPVAFMPYISMAFLICLLGRLWILKRSL